MKVLLVTGSSGGHIFPALALMDSLKSSGADVLMVLPKKDNGVQVNPESGSISYIHSSDLSLKLSSKNIRGVFFFLVGAGEGLKIIIKFKPDAVVGFGSLNTVALLFWAWLFRIKTIIHEQNVIPGRANRLLAKLVDKVAVSFPQTGNYLAVSPDKIILTGNPLRKGMLRLDRKEALDFFNFKEGKFNILITGGSQGSHKLNTILSAALSDCCRKDDLQVVHISGLKDFSLVEQAYARSGLAHKVFEFLTGMQYAYSIADLVICRAGATTISELQKFKLPALLIPYPFAYAHQSANAGVLEGNGAALIVRDDDLSVDKIKVILEGFLKDRQKLERMRQAYGLIQSEDACRLLTGEVLSLN
ncbi:MAG: UDP-N-acetylglucosamine--N-acetylmuramyl-(pentapeptide) pyrophosphoryl-undecaprenol N-acetylglucosamine transferase [Candidatus Omnitrophota bacterium]|jgi:UDP-N-acetylglucosamine--N-acetylmuramyl-(pentapeptide) pyrophosphoryl-undecaprenol N-acetylglucosamine transferase